MLSHMVSYSSETRVKLASYVINQMCSIIVITVISTILIIRIFVMSITKASHKKHPFVKSQTTDSRTTGID